MKPAAWANQLIKVWRAYRPQANSEYPVSVRELIEGYINPKYSSEPITITPLALDSIEGVLVKTQSGWTIGYNKDIEHRGRVNFTLAHELGHYLCHRALRTRFDCGQQQMMDNGSKEDTVDVEREANEFAATLLMPFDDYRKEVESKEVTVEVISDCAERYAVSWTAAVFHWLKFTGQKAIFVHSRDGHVIRAKSSKTALRASLFFRSGHELPAQCLTLKCEKEGNSDDTRNGILQPKDVWHPNYEVMESTMFSRKFNDWSYTILLYK